MKVFVAGATGALGKQLVPRLVAAGHEVTGMTRSVQRADLVRELGAEPAVADALDPDAVGAAISAAGPEVILHELTALSESLDLRHFERDFAQTNRLRTEGTDILLSAARAAGTRRFVAQSYAGWPTERRGGPVKSEDDPFDQHPPAAVRTSLEAIAYLERAVTGAAPIEGLVLRYGGFYGPGTSLRLDPPGGEHVEAIRGRKFPIVGGAAASGHSSTSRTPPRRPRSRSSAACRASTTSSTTSPRRSATGCRRRPARSAGSARCGCRGGSAGSWPARRRR
jgi:2-alkyl-3-oxoalkanoate reductase